MMISSFSEGIFEYFFLYLQISSCILHDRGNSARIQFQNIVQCPFIFMWSLKSHPLHFRNGDVCHCYFLFSCSMYLYTSKVNYEHVCDRAEVLLYLVIGFYWYGLYKSNIRNSPPPLRGNFVRVATLNLLKRCIEVNIWFYSVCC